MKIACVMARRFEIKPKSAHIDGTSMSVQGKYLASEKGKIAQSSAENNQDKAE